MRKPTTNRTKGQKNRPKTKLAIPDLEHLKTRGFTKASARQTQGVGTSMPLMSSSPGIVLSHGWHSTKQWFCVTRFYLEEPRPCSGNYQRSTCSRAPGWLTKQP